MPRKENPLAMPLALYYQKPPWLPHREYAKHPLTSTRHHHKTLGISLEAQSVGKIRDHPRSLLLLHRPENPNPTTKSSCLSKNRIFFNLQDSIFSYCICGDSIASFRYLMIFFPVQALLLSLLLKVFEMFSFVFVGIYGKKRWVCF